MSNDLVATANALDKVHFNAADGANKGHGLARLGLEDAMKLPLSAGLKASISGDAQSAVALGGAARDGSGVAMERLLGTPTVKTPEVVVSAARPAVVPTAKAGTKFDTFRV